MINKILAWNLNGKLHPGHALSTRQYLRQFLMLSEWSCFAGSCCLFQIGPGCSLGLSGHEVIWGVTPAVQCAATSKLNHQQKDLFSKDCLLKSAHLRHCLLHHWEVVFAGRLGALALEQVKKEEQLSQFNWVIDLLQISGQRNIVHWVLNGSTRSPNPGQVQN